MNKIYQYRPSFFEGFNQEIVSFNSLNEMLSIPFVKNFSEDKNFDRFSLAQEGHYLFAEYWINNKHEWWCVGWFEDDNDPNINCLPELLHYPHK